MRAGLPVAVLLTALGIAGAAEPGAENSAATVTATPPAQAHVKPLTPQQAQQRQLRCEKRAREHHIKSARRQAYIVACLLQTT
ncbi:MAG: hypothetical protein ABIT36_09145 [Steroidobacteraceae bacterium]